ncbi:MAG TPA: methylenetetrahydrofolate reductase C-terminal domain-containing protein [Terriglobales bacterium]|nr:methylenetetrahydrofolate reductase C-terminal domain-containing protein [Terriglobales bacterium]
MRSAVQAGMFVCTAELVLGRDHNAAEAEEFVREASREADGIKVISLTDLPGGQPALPPEAFVSYVRAHHLTPIAHLAGKDGNRSLLEGRLLTLARLGVENILALTGDAQKQGFVGESKPVYDLDSVLILWLLRALRRGSDYNVEMKTACATHFDFFPGAVVNPYKVREPDLLMQLYKLRLKVAAGAQFIITQIGYNLRKLYELKQYLVREGIGHVPVLANIYVPTATIARKMQSGEIAGCVITDEFVKRLEKEKKPQRLERAALMVSAVKDLGFAGAHIGGFGLCHRDFMVILERASAIGKGWRARMDELVYPWPGEFHLLPLDTNGFSDGAGSYQTARTRPHATLVQRICELAYRHLIKDDSPAARFFGTPLKSQIRSHGGNSWRHSVWCMLLAPSTLFRKATLDCLSCGDCLQDHLSYAGCSMRWCYKELRNGPCGGSRVDGSCEARPEVPCIWNLIYSATLAMRNDPDKFTHILVPPRDWHLNHTNALVNRLAGLDNFHKRKDLGKIVNPDA